MLICEKLKYQAALWALHCIYWLHHILNEEQIIQEIAAQVGSGSNWASLFT